MTGYRRPDDGEAIYEYDTIWRGNVTSAGWPVTPCDPMWHVSSRRGQASCKLLYLVHLLLPLPPPVLVDSQLPAWAFLLVFYRNHSPKIHREKRKRQTDASPIGPTVGRDTITSTSFLHAGSYRPTRLYNARERSRRKSLLRNRRRCSKHVMNGERLWIAIKINS